MTMEKSVRKMVKLTFCTIFPFNDINFHKKNDGIGHERSAKLFVCVEVLQPSQPNGVMSSAVSLPNHTFTGQA